jgi:uncharacterized protein YciI
MSKHTPPQVDFELDTFELLILRRPDPLPPYDEAMVKQIQAQHVKHLLAQQAAGVLLAAGAIVNHQSLTGFAFYRTGSLERVRQLAEEDPAIRAGIDAYEVVNFACPKGAIHFPLSGKRAA